MWRNQDEMHQVAQHEAFDVACPTTDRLKSWLESELIAPLDEDRIGYGRIDPAFHANAQTMIDGTRMGSPSIWGGAGIGHHIEVAPLDPSKAILMDLFDPAHAGRLAMREDTAFVAAGRALEAAGKLPFPFDASYVDEQTMIANYDVISAFLIDHAHHVARFWFSEEEGGDAFRSGYCVIGYSWDSTLAQLWQEKRPYRFVAPVEGTNCYLQNFVLGADADADAGRAAEWISWVNTPQGGGALCHGPWCEPLRPRGRRFDAGRYARLHARRLSARGFGQALVAAGTTALVCPQPRGIRAQVPGGGWEMSVSVSNPFRVGGFTVTPLLMGEIVERSQDWFYQTVSSTPQVLPVICLHIAGPDCSVMVGVCDPALYPGPHGPAAPDIRSSLARGRNCGRCGQPCHPDPWSPRPLLRCLGSSV